MAAELCLDLQIIINMQCRYTCSSKSNNLTSHCVHLVLENAFRADDFIEDVLANVRIDGTQRIIKQVDVSILVDGTCQAHTLFLTSTQVYALIHSISLYTASVCSAVFSEIVNNRSKTQVTNILLTILHTNSNNYDC